jgi:DNA invertase Pin-like site-specific DNA recombinase
MCAVNSREASVLCRGFFCASFKNGFTVSSWFYDKGISGRDYLHNRPEFQKLLNYCNQNNIKKILIESADRLSRDLIGIANRAFCAEKII